MINILRIISLIAAILAVVFLVFPIVYGTHNDEHVKEFLETPEMREKFESAADSRLDKNKDRTSPLVQQAQAFASYLNPKPTERATTRSIGSKVTHSLPVTPKFTLHCTSYCPDDPNMSLALIDEPGKGRYWVKPSSKVGHFLVEQIQDGLIVVNNGQESYERKIEESSVKDSPTPSRKTSPQTRFKSTTPVSGRSSARYTQPSTTLTKTQEKDDDTDREARAIALIEKLRTLQKSTVSDKNEGVDDKEKAARIEKLISQYQSTRISPEEAKKLGNLGKTLKDAESDPNRTPSETGKTR
jgi:hypothetical protein